MMNKSIVLASGNAGKLKEFQLAFKALPFELKSQANWDFPEAEETGLTFVENALIKARHAALHTGLPALADDSGLVVEALGGAPGIYSARYASSVTPDPSNTEFKYQDSYKLDLEKQGLAKAPNQDSLNNQKLLQDLAHTPAEQRQAAFVAVLVFLRHAEDPTPIIAQGRWQGEIALEASGTDGFGYDPIFYIPSLGKTAAELEAATKLKLSHRGQAIQALLQQFKQQFSHQAGQPIL